MTCTAKYTTTATDVHKGSITNIGKVTGKAATGTKVHAKSKLILPFTKVHPKLVKPRKSNRPNHP